MEKTLKRIVVLVDDASTIGGIQTRTLKTIRNSLDRHVEYVCISRERSIPDAIPEDIAEKILFVSEDQDAVLKEMSSWMPGNTVIWFSNFSLIRFPQRVRCAIEAFPLVFVGAGQLSYHIQHSKELQDRDVLEDFRVSAVVLLSKSDKMIYNQFGCYGQDVGFNPVEIREENTWRRGKNRHFTYIGALHDPTKGTDRLLDIAETLGKLSLGPLRIFTPSIGKNAARVEAFMKQVRDRDLDELIDIRLDEKDLEVMLDEAAALVLPSRLESFGNVILEAYSYGVPVITSAHAPGPSSLVRDGVTGYLIEDYTSAELEQVLWKVASLGPDGHFSSACFEEHKKFAMTRYYEYLESVSERVVREFDGCNRKRVFPFIQARPGAGEVGLRTLMRAIRKRVRNAIRPART